jgi:hypothetical protein
MYCFEWREKEMPPPGTLGSLAARVMFSDQCSDSLAAPNITVMGYQICILHDANLHFMHGVHT